MQSGLAQEIFLSKHEPDDRLAVKELDGTVVMAVLLGGTMDLASVFDWFAQESTSAAEQTDEPRQREMWMKLSELWGAAAHRCREEQSTLRPGTQQSISASS
jgi:hypothetical protein